MWTLLLPRKIKAMELKQHIGIFHNAVPAPVCEAFVRYFDWAQQHKMTHARKEIGAHVPTKQTADEGVSFFSQNIDQNIEPFSAFRHSLDQCYLEYTDKYIGLQTVEGLSLLGANIQKTLPTQGYHVWHFESGSYESSRRVVVFSVYLNTVEEGGETEFIDQSMRVKATQGTLVLWPAAYTHTHRGNPPLSGEKYLLTGWIGFR
jgi:hypothetical protein